MAKLMYCLQCEEMVAVEEPIEGHSVVEFVPDEGQSEVLWCEGGFTTCPPEHSDPDWDMQDEPSQEELVRMNLAAEELLADLDLE